MQWSTTGSSKGGDRRNSRCTLPSGTKQHLIQWKGISDQHNTWEHEEILGADWLKYFWDKSGKTDSWEVEQVLDTCTLRPGATEYLICWKGFSEAQDSWEPDANLSETALEDFRARECLLNGLPPVLGSR